MPLKTPEQYVESLRALEIRAYVGGERLDSIVDHPATRRRGRLGQTTGTCFQRCVGLDALNATYATTYEVGSTRDDGTTLPRVREKWCASGPRCK